MCSCQTAQNRPILKIVNILNLKSKLSWEWLFRNKNCATVTVSGQKMAARPKENCYCDNIFMLPLFLRCFRCWVRYPLVKGLCLIAKETEQGVTITLAKGYFPLPVKHIKKIGGGCGVNRVLCSFGVLLAFWSLLVRASLKQFFKAFPCFLSVAPRAQFLLRNRHSQLSCGYFNVP